MKLKKILSLVVTLSLVFSMVTISNVHAAGDEFSILKTLGIRTDFSDKTTPITRYQLAEFLLEFAGLSPDPEGVPVYPDVPVRHKAFPVINKVTMEGLMGARADGSFGLDSYAADLDGARLILTELGYTAFAKQAEWTDAQYNSKIQSLGLLKSVDTSNPLTYYDLGKMFLNMLDTKVMIIESVTDEGINFVESDLTYIEYKYGYIFKTGVMEAFETASMSGKATTGRNKAVIDGVIYKTDGNDYSGYVGCTVKYVLSSVYEDAQLIYITKKSPTQELVIDAEDIVKYDNYKLYYIDEDGSQEVVTFSSSTRFVVNGQNMGTFNAKYFTPKFGSVTFVDTDGDDVYNLVNINSKIYFKVGAADANKLVDQITLTTVFANSDSYKTYTYANGNGIGMSTYATGSYLEVAPGVFNFEPEDGKEVVKVDLDKSKVISINQITTTTVSGKVMGKKTSGITLDGVNYDFSPYYSYLLNRGDVAAISLGANIDVVLNEKGQIIDIPNVKTDYIEVSKDLTYGYLFKINPDRKNEQGAYIKMIDIYKLEEKLFKTAADCKLNGKEFDYSKLIAVNPETTATSIFWPDGSEKHQLVKYSLNNNGEIDNIYLYSDFSNEYLMTGYGTFSDTLRNPDFNPIYEGYDDRYFTIDRVKSMTGYRAMLEQLYTIDKDRTIQLEIPPDPTMLDYWTVKIGDDPNEQGGSIVGESFEESVFEIYDSSESFVPSVLVKRSAGSGSDEIEWKDGYFRMDDRSTYVTDIQIVLDEIDNCEKTQIIGYRAVPGGVEKVSYIPTDNNMLAKDKLSLYNMRDNGTNYFDYNYTWQDIKVGDIIRVKVDHQGRVAWFGLQIKAEYIEDVNNLQYGPLSYFSPGKKNVHNHYDLGYVTKVFPTEESAIMNLEGPGGSTAGLYKIIKPRTLAAGHSTIGATMIIHTKSKTVEIGDVTNLKVGDAAIVHVGYGSVNELIILRE